MMPGNRRCDDVWEDVITVDTNSAATATEAGTNYLSQRTLTRKMVIPHDQAARHSARADADDQPFPGGT